MIYDNFKFIYPPRAESKTKPALISMYDTEEYIAQPKYNGSCCNVFLHYGAFIKVINRHGEQKTRVDSFIKFEQIETQNKNRTSTISKDETVSSKAIFGIGLLFFGIVLLFVLGLSFYDKNASQSTNSNSSSSSPSSTSNSYEQPQESSTMANCVVCGKRVDYYQENTFSGHHFKVSGLMSSDVVCGLECDVTLRRRNERTINREMTDPNSYRDPDIKMPDFNK